MIAVGTIGRILCFIDLHCLVQELLWLFNFKLFKFHFKNVVATFQVLNGHMWLAAIIPASIIPSSQKIPLHSPVLDSRDHAEVEEPNDIFLMFK